MTLAEERTWALCVILSRMSDEERPRLLDKMSLEEVDRLMEVIRGLEDPSLAALEAMSGQRFKPDQTASGEDVLS